MFCADLVIIQRGSSSIVFRALEAAVPYPPMIRSDVTNKGRSLPVALWAVHTYMRALCTPSSWRSLHRRYPWKGRYRGCHGSQFGQPPLESFIAGFLFLSLRTKGFWHLLFRWFNFFFYAHNVEPDLGCSCWVVQLALFLRWLLGL